MAAHSDFDALQRLAELAPRAARKLEVQLSGTQNDEPGAIEDMAALRAEADAMRNALMETLAREFIAPIEREDVARLAHVTIDVTDGIADASMQLYAGDVRKPRIEALEMFEQLRDGADALHEAFQALPQYKRKGAPRESIAKLDKVAREAGMLRAKAMRRMHAGQCDANEVLRWTPVLERLATCCERCRHAGHALEEVILRNT